MILAGDVGGTKTKLSLFSRANGALVRGATETFDSRSAASLEAIIKGFLDKNSDATRRSTVETACLGVPGPVHNGIAKITNLPWTVSATSLSRELGLPRVRLVNDLAAYASAIPLLSENQLTTLYPGTPTPAADDVVFAVVAPGTGLGEAVLVRNKGKYIPLASEGGHVDFAPTSEDQSELLKYLRVKFPRVSIERVLCGPGLVNIYSFLRDTKREEEPRELRDRLAGADAATEISRAGLADEYPICVRTLDIFAEALGTECGNMMLKVLAFGGVYLGGGIPAKLIEKLKDGSVVKGYLNKGRLSETVKIAPLKVIIDSHAPLLGAASLALEA